MGNAVCVHNGFELAYSILYQPALSQLSYPQGWHSEANQVCHGRDRFDDMSQYLVPQECGPLLCGNRGGQTESTDNGYWAAQGDSAWSTHQALLQSEAALQAPLAPAAGHGPAETCCPACRYGKHMHLPNSMSHLSWLFCKCVKAPAILNSARPVLLCVVHMLG